MPTPTIAIVGSGANGASIGADLIAAGHDVTLVEQWPAHVEAMRTDGLTIRMHDRTLVTHPKTLHVCQVAEQKRPFDVVLIVMKAYDTRWAAELIAPLVAHDGVVAAVQNGMTTDAAAAAVGIERTVGAVIEISSTMSAPGVVDRHTPPERSWFAVDADPRADRVAELLGASGTVARIGDIASAKWMKLVSNSSVLVTTASLGLSMTDAIRVPGMREAMIRAGQEALAVGRARGHRPLPIFGLVDQDLSDEAAIVETMLDILYDRFVVEGATTTVLQDWLKARRSEAGDINGLVCREGARLGVPTPTNDAILALAQRIEAGETTPRLDNAAAVIG